MTFTWQILFSPTKDSVGTTINSQERISNTGWRQHTNITEQKRHQIRCCIIDLYSTIANKRKVVSTLSSLSLLHGVKDSSNLQRD